MYVIRKILAPLLLLVASAGCDASVHAVIRLPGHHVLRIAFHTSSQSQQ